MRRLGLIAAVLLSIVMVAGVFAASPGKDKPVKVLVNGKRVSLKPGAFARGKTVYLPLEATAKAANATVKWDKAKKAYVVTSAGKTATVIQASQVVKANGTAMIPLALAASALSCDAKWVESAKTVNLSAKVQGAGSSSPCG
jgi:hypothetical protein